MELDMNRAVATVGYFAFGKGVTEPNGNEHWQAFLEKVFAYHSKCYMCGTSLTSDGDCPACMSDQYEYLSGDR